MRTRQARWAAATATHRRCTAVLVIILLLWLCVIVRYYYQFHDHEHSSSADTNGVNPHRPHGTGDGALTSSHKPTRQPPPPEPSIDDLDSRPEPSYPDDSSNTNSESSESSESSSSNSDRDNNNNGNNNGHGGSSRSNGVHVPEQQRHHRMSSPAIVIVGHDRDKNIRALYDSLITQPSIEQFKMYISCDLPSMQHKIMAALPHDANVTYWWHHPMTASGQFAAWQSSGLFRISYHFKMALTRVFDEAHHSHAILIEEDLLVAPDFLQLFIDTSWLLDADPSLYCISAWNDNGFRTLTHDTQRLFRTGYFPGLGWMIKRDMWTDHLRSSWPPAATTGWDHWLRLSSISQYRECISPEVPRTQHTSESGINVNSASAALFAKYAFSNEQPKLDGSGFGDTSTLLQDEYDTYMKQLVKSAARIDSIHDIGSASDAGVYVLPYREEQYHILATTLGLWPDHGARGWYHGIITTRLAGRSDIIILLAERRRAAAYLRDGEGIVPMRDTTLVAAKGGENCNAACTRSTAATNMRQKPGAAPRTLKCFDSEIAFVNTCESLAKVFACEGGCGHQIGGELPAYVIDSTERTYQQCLITDGANNCMNAHPATQRVCPCNPSP